MGATALAVAAARAVETRRAQPLVDDPYAQAFVDTAGLDVSLPGTATADARTDRGWEELSTYQGVRSRYFDEYFAAAAAAGIRQMVLLAAGLDARAYRLPWPDGVTVYEIDQPAVLAFKDQVLDARSATAAVSRIPVTTDLREDWPAALEAAGFDTSQPTAWLAEGLLPYLPAAAEADLFERIEGLSVPGSRVAVEHFAANVDDWGRHPHLAHMNKMIGADIRDLVYSEPREQTPEAVLATLGWKPSAVSARDLAVAYQRPLPADVADIMGEIELLEAVRLDA